MFSDMDMEFTDGTGSPFEDEGAFGQTPEFEQTESMPVSGGQMVEEMELPVPQAGSRRINDDTDSKQEEAKKDCSGEMVASMKISDKPELDADNKKAQAAAEEEKRRNEHEAAEAQRKAEWDAVQEAKKAAELEQLDHLKAMSDDEIMEASVKRVSRDTERLTRRNMKECVSEYIQTLCFSDPVCQADNAAPQDDNSLLLLHQPQSYGICSAGDERQWNQAGRTLWSLWK